MITPSQILTPVLAALDAAWGPQSAAPQKARVSVAATLRHALEGLFDSPAGFNIVLAPGDEAPASDSLAGDQFDAIQVLNTAITVTVAHKLPPTAKPMQALYESVGGADPFLDLVDGVKHTVMAVEMPAGTTGVYWAYKGRQTASLDGVLLSAFNLSFELEISASDQAEIQDPNLI